MGHLLLSVFGFLIAVIILVTVHEFGHFIVARAFGIRVDRFSIGFGRPLFRWYDKMGTEYVIAAIPLGGYVSLFGEKATEITGSERYEAFCYKSVWVRISVLLAGPLFNIILAVIAFWLMFIIGITSLAPILGHVPKGSIADLAGLHQHQEIVSIENKPTHNWEAVSVAMVSALGKDHTVTLTVKEMNDEENKTMETHTLDLSSLEKSGEHGDVLKDLGLVPFDPFPAVIGKVLPDTPAFKSGLKPGDRIVAVNRQPVASRMDLSEIIQANIGKVLKFEVMREPQIQAQTQAQSQIQQNNNRESKQALKSNKINKADKKSNTENEHLIIQIQPMAKQLEGKEVGFIGVEFVSPQKPPKEYLRTERFGVIDGFVQALKHTWEYVILTFSLLKKMIVGIISVKHLSGPIAIANIAGHTVSIGFEYFLNFLAVISISLGVINLLPIPLLDGGHLMFCVWELVTGRAASPQVQLLGAWLGGAFLLIITFLAIYNDLVHLFM